MEYINKREIFYYSKRFNRSVTVEKGFVSDGATGAIDIYTDAWMVHDKICTTWKWDDGTPITNWQASWVLSDILREDGYWIRCHTWFWATLYFGYVRELKNKLGD